MSLPLNLWKYKEEIRQYAVDFGLDFFEVVYELVSSEKVNEIASYGGFPVRYPHWRFGMEYERMAKSHLYGLHKIYEMVINNDPCYAYLVDGSADVDYKLIMAHVYAHSDFFKNNMWFAHTNRKMMDEMANHATRVRRYIDRYGLSRVETFIDAVLSIDSLVDYHFPDQGQRPRVEGQDPSGDHRFAVKAPEYLEEFMYPEDYVEDQRRKVEAEKQRSRRNPPRPVKDVMFFLVQNAPLENWERDILSMLREESLYFAPQGQTKIMNEGWAAYWHSRILTEKALNSSEIVDFADHHSQTVATYGKQLNPYKLGVELFRDIEDRWNRGRFGKEWEECDDARRKGLWDRDLGLGREKIFEVRRVYNDVAFLDEFLTPEFCVENKLFTWLYQARNNRVVIDSRDFEAVKSSLLRQITNFGRPAIRLVDSDFRGRGELLLVHLFEGEELDRKYGADVLASLVKIWRRPVNLVTSVGKEGQLWTHDASTFKTESFQWEGSAELGEDEEGPN